MNNDDADTLAVHTKVLPLSLLFIPVGLAVVGEALSIGETVGEARESIKSTYVHI